MKFRLSITHELIGDGYVLARDGENNSIILVTTIEDQELLNKNCYIEFEKDDGSTFVTPILDVVDGVVTYSLGNGLCDGTYLKIQYVFRDNDNYCWKSFIKKFIIVGSVNADANYPIEYPNFITEAQTSLSEYKSTHIEIQSIKENLTERMDICEETIGNYEANEINRESNEDSRVASELERQLNEDVREENESGRVNAEENRVIAENNRVNEFNSMMYSLNEIKVLNNMVNALENVAYSPIESQDSFVTRVTAEGENIVDGAYVLIKILGGRTLKVDENLINASVSRIVERKGTLEDSLEIPNEIRQLDCYGVGLSDSDKNLMNYIDFEKNQYVQNIKKVNAWEMNWTYNSTLRYYTSYGINSSVVIPATNSTIGNLISNHLQTDTYSHIYSNAVNYDNCVGIVATPLSSTGSICVSKQQFNDVPSFVQFLQQNNVIFYYQIKTPIVTNITLPKKKLQAFNGGQESLESADNVPAYLESIYRVSKN